MSSRETLIGDIVRLRRVERGLAALSAVSEVRADLEQLTGSAVARATAARLLGISQTALDRRIGGGDIPVVVTPAGRREVPLSALVDLLDAVDARRAGGSPRPLAAVIRDRRETALSLDPELILPRRFLRDAGKHGHRRAELRGLAYHRAVALRLDAALVTDARRRLRRWRQEERIDPRWADAWDEVLSLPVERIAKLISSDSERARDLRQSSPFAGVLNEQERQRVLEIAGRAH